MSEITTTATTDLAKASTNLHDNVVYLPPARPTDPNAVSYTVVAHPPTPRDSKLG